MRYSTGQVSSTQYSITREPRRVQLDPDRVPDWMLRELPSRPVGIQALPLEYRIDRVWPRMSEEGRCVPSDTENIIGIV